MEGAETAKLGDVDRDSLVKEIELIRQTLGVVSNTVTEQSDSRTEYDLEDGKLVEEISDDSEDELAIIKSPEYIQDLDDEKILNEQRVPVDVISSDSETEETADESALGNIQLTSEQSEKHNEITQDSNGDITYKISAIYPCDNSDEVELILTPVSPYSQQRQTNDAQEEGQSKETQGILIPGSLAYQASAAQIDSPVYSDDQNDEYTLTELHVQPPKKNFTFERANSKEDFCRSPVYEMPSEYAYLESVSETEQMKDVETGAEELGNQTETLNDDYTNNDNVGEQSEVRRCLSLNRKYQAIIEEELRRTERSLLENIEVQLGLTHMTQRSIAQAEALVFKRLSSCSNPYFKDKSKESPPDNEDTKLRKSIGQPYPFEKASKPWGKEENKILSDAVKSDVLATKLTPLLQRIEALTPRKSKTEEEEREIETLKAVIEQTKSLPLANLVENYALPIDWEDISYKMLPSRTPSQCEIYWYNELHPLLNKDLWTKDEDKQLLKFANENSNEDWNKIAHELKTNRSAVQCLGRFQKSLHKGFLKSKWNEEEDKQLLEAVKMCGLGAWEKVSSLLEGRTGAQCMHRYTKSIDPNIRRGKWDAEEDDLLRKGVEKFGSNWSKIRNLIPRRTDSQIRERWSDVLDPCINKGEWRKKEDELLLKVVKEQGTGNWTNIASQIKGRNDNRCWRRWRLLMKNDPTFQSQCHSYERKKATMVVNFSGRPQDRPAIGPEDVDSSGQPILTPVNSNRSAASVTTTANSSTERMPTPLSYNTPRSSPLNGSKRVSKPNASPWNVKRKRTSNSVNWNVSRRQDHSQRKSPSTIPTTTQNTPVHSRNPSHYQTRKKKLTMPSPTVVSQASALPNALPMSYLTQFSVLLQAFSVDVSGALKNVQSTEAPGTRSQSALNDTSASTASGSVNDRANVVTQSSSEVAQVSSVNNNNESRIGCPAENTSVIIWAKKHDDEVHETVSTISKQTAAVVAQKVRSVDIQEATNCNVSGTCVSHEVQSSNGPGGTNCDLSRTCAVQEVESGEGPESTNHDISGACISQEVHIDDEPDESNHDISDAQAFSQEVQMNDKPYERNHDISGTCISQEVQINDEPDEKTHDISGTCISQEVHNDEPDERNHDRSGTCISQEVHNDEPDERNHDRSGTCISQEVHNDEPDERNHDRSGTCISQEVHINDEPDERNHDISVTFVSHKVQNEKQKKGGKNKNDSSDSRILQEKTNLDGQNGTNCNGSNTTVSPKAQITIESEGTNPDVNDTCVIMEVRNSSEQEKINRDACGSLASRQVKITDEQRKGNNEIHTGDIKEGKEIVQQKEESTYATSEGNSQDACAPDGHREKKSDDPNTACSGGVILSGSRHGLTHEIVIFSSSSSEEMHAKTNDGKLEECVAAICSKRKNGAIKTGNAKKRRRKISKGSKNKQSKHGATSCSEIDLENNDKETDGATGIIEECADKTVAGDAKRSASSVDKNGNAYHNTAPSARNITENALDNGTIKQHETVKRRYPLRASRGPPKFDLIFSEIAVDTRIDKVVSKSAFKAITTRRGRRKSQTPKKLVNDVEKSARDASAIPTRASIVPPLPPSATTLNAFKKLLTSRKSLQSQANCLEQAPAKQKGAEESNTSIQTRVNNPLADRLLVDSGQASVDDYSHSVPYQQLVNRFKGLFLWPGFLSIVNPNFGSKRGGTTSTPRNNTNQSSLRKRT